MKAYKVFNEDFTCRNFQYEVGKTYIHEEQIKLCGSGFHACLKTVDCFNYYFFDSKNKVCEVELMGNIEHGDDKSVCSEIKIIREISWHDVLSLVNTGKDNTGHRNSGHRNSGDRNSGHRNSGDSNSGDRNSGHRNSGDSNSGHRNSGHWNSGDSNSGDSNSGHRNSGHWNSCDREAGYFNSSENNEIRVFNKSCSKALWDKVEKPEFIYNLILNEWTWFSDMSDEEKKNYPKAYVCNGYLKTFSYKDAWRNAYCEASIEEVELLKKLPNFDATIFEDITGIKIK
jgi:hypothetical protein